MSKQQEQMNKRINHTAKLVPQNQRDLFISEINQIIDLAVAEERKRIVEKIEERQDLFNFVPEINGYKYIKAKDLDILSLITKEN